MAVPKQKQSHARTNKRRSTHKISAPAINAVPAVPPAAPPAPGVPATAAPTPVARSCTCTTTITTTTATSTRSTASRARWPLSQPLTIALDANGADAGPAEVARGAALAAARGDVRVLVFGPAAEIEPAPGRRGRRRAGLDRQGGRSRARRARRRPTRRSCRPCSAVADGRADALVSGGSTGAALAAGLFHVKRAPRHPPAGAGRARARCPASRSCCSTAAPTSRSGPSTSSSSPTWARRSWRP